MLEHSKRRDPRKRQPTGKAVLLSARDIEILKLLNRYRYLRSNFIRAFFPNSDRGDLLDRLGDLFHEQPWVDRPRQQFRWSPRGPVRHHTIYEITPLGRQVLRYQGITPLLADKLAGSIGVTRHFPHALMVCDLLASIELGCREKGIRFISWEEILNKAPCRDHKNPFKIPINQKLKAIVPDALFGLEYPNKTYRFFVLEADRGTMPIYRNNLNQTSYTKKLLQYREILSKKIYKSHFGIPNLYVLNVTTSEERMNHMIEALNQITSSKGNSVFLFKHQINHILCSPPADANMLKQPWSRAKYPNFRIDK